MIFRTLSFLVLGSELSELFETSVATPKDLGSAEDDRIFLRVVRVVFGGNFQDSRDDLFVFEDNISHTLSDFLADEDDTNIGTGKEFSEGLVDITVSSIFIDDLEVALSFTVALSHAGQEEPSDRSFISDDGSE